MGRVLLYMLLVTGGTVGGLAYEVGRVPMLDRPGWRHVTIAHWALSNPMQAIADFADPERPIPADTVTELGRGTTLSPRAVETTSWDPPEEAVAVSVTGT